MLDAAPPPVAAVLQGPQSARPVDPYHHGDLRRALLDEAERQLDERGVACLSLRGLARATGVSVAAPYYHFRDKHDLLGALVARGLDALEETVERAPYADTRHRAETVCLAHLRFSRARPGLYALMYDMARRDGDDGRAGQVPRDCVAYSPRAQRADRADDLTKAALNCLALGVAALVDQPGRKALIDRPGGDERFIRRLFQRISSLLEGQHVQS